MSFLTALQVGLDLAISFSVVVFQSIVRHVKLEEEPVHLQTQPNGTVTLSKQFMEDDEEEEVA